jgi:hypothetical protein
MKQMYDKKCSWCYFGTGKKEKIKEVHILSRDPYKVVFKTRSGVYLYDGKNTLDDPSILEDYSWSCYFYYIGCGSKALNQYTVDDKIVLFQINKVELCDKHLGIRSDYNV